MSEDEDNLAVRGFCVGAYDIVKAIYEGLKTVC